jgi:hypothetical protein
MTVVNTMSNDELTELASSGRRGWGLAGEELKRRKTQELQETNISAVARYIAHYAESAAQKAAMEASGRIVRHLWGAHSKYLLRHKRAPS